MLGGVVGEAHQTLSSKLRNLMSRSFTEKKILLFGLKLMRRK